MPGRSWDALHGRTGLTTRLQTLSKIILIPGQWCVAEADAGLAKNEAGTSALLMRPLTPGLARYRLPLGQIIRRRRRRDRSLSERASL